MANLTLATLRTPDQPTECERLHAEWRHAKAVWDAQSYSPEYWAEGLPDEVDSELCGAACDALNRYLLEPAACLRDLAIKLRVFRDEEIVDGWARGQEIAGVLAADAQRLAFGAH